MRSSGKTVELDDPAEINRRALAYLEANTYYEPTEILKEDWFVEHVILNPMAAGAIRALLGRDFGLPILMSQHRLTDRDSSDDEVLAGTTLG